MIPRIIDLQQAVQVGKVTILYGSRRTGKTTLVKQFLAHTSQKYLLVSWESLQIQTLFADHDDLALHQRVAGYELLVIDEAQVLPQLGLCLKMIIDAHPQLTILVTWSSSFLIRQKTGEPLLGRKNTLMLYTISVQELAMIHNTYELQHMRNALLLYGSYPEVLTLSSIRDKQSYLAELVDSYLLKDILQLDKVKASSTLVNLIKLLAYQIGNEVSHHELASKLGIHTKTVARYIDLLVQWFVILPLTPYMRNMRNALTKKNKYYFRDLGIRNAVINNFEEIHIRADLWALRENFVIIEFIKHYSYQKWYKDILLNHFHFWRSYSGAEIDMIIEQGDMLYCYECKYSPKKTATIPQEFVKHLHKWYHYEVIHTDNYLQKISG